MQIFYKDATACVYAVLMHACVLYVQSMCNCIGHLAKNFVINIHSKLKHLRVYTLYHLSVALKGTQIPINLLIYAQHAQNKFYRMLSQRGNDFGAH
jgi:hypothetical protein